LSAKRSRAEWSFYATLFASTFLFGSSFVAGKVLINAGVPAVLLAGFRLLAAAIAALPFVVAERPRSSPLWRLSGREVALVVLIGLLQTTGVMTLLFTSLRWMPASVAAIIMSTSPIWVALAGRLWLGDVMSSARYGGLVLGVVGVALAIGIRDRSINPDEAPMWLGPAVCLAAAFCWSAATIVAKRARLSLSPWALTFWQMLIGSLVIIAIAYTLGERWPERNSMTEWLWFAWLAVPGSTAAFGLWFIALSRGGAIRTSSFLFLAPLFATLLSIAVFGTIISMLQVAGGVLIAVALWLVNRGPDESNGSAD